MEWIIQNNLYDELKDFEIIKNTFDRFDIKYYEVSVQRGIVVPELNLLPYKKYMILGGYSLMRFAQKNKLTPGCYTKNMNMTSWMKNYKNNMLNHDAKITTLSSVNKTKPFFIRPEQDSKAFSGIVFNNMDDFIQWRNELLQKSDMIHNEHETKVIVSPCKNIIKETRFFIIDNRIVSASVYKINGIMQTSPIIDIKAIDFVNDMIDLWTPDKAFVMDVATIYDENNGIEDIKIVELNCINCSGFYEADIQKIIMELNYHAMS